MHAAPFLSRFLAICPEPGHSTELASIANGGSGTLPHAVPIAASSTADTRLPRVRTDLQVLQTRCSISLSSKPMCA